MVEAILFIRWNGHSMRYSHSSVHSFVLCNLFSKVERGEIEFNEKSPGVSITRQDFI